MGFEYRKKTGNVIAGSKLNVTGQGILTVKGDNGIKLIKTLPNPTSTNKGNLPLPPPL